MTYFELIFSILFLISVFSFFSLAPWVPTKKIDLERINKVIKLKESESFLEIWCWTALVSLYLAEKNTNSKIYWIELSPFFYIVSKIKVYFSWLKNIEIKYWNALKLDFTKYDVVYVFGLPDTISRKILPKLFKVTNKKFRFISYCFKMTNDFFKEIKHKNWRQNSVYEYYL